jgi:hypothetical protein
VADTTLTAAMAVFFFAEQSDRNSEMAARLRVRHQDEIREKIKTSQLINRLTDCGLGDLELTAQQLKAIEILLRKSLPDLSAVSIEGTGENGDIPITFTWANQPAS